LQETEAEALLRPPPRDAFVAALSLFRRSTALNYKTGLTRRTTGSVELCRFEVLDAAQICEAAADEE